MMQHLHTRRQLLAALQDVDESDNQMGPGRSQIQSPKQSQHHHQECSRTAIDAAAAATNRYGTAMAVSSGSGEKKTTTAPPQQSKEQALLKKEPLRLRSFLSDDDQDNTPEEEEHEEHRQRQQQHEIQSKNITAHAETDADIPTPTHARITFNNGPSTPSMLQDDAHRRKVQPRNGQLPPVGVDIDLRGSNDDGQHKQQLQQHPTVAESLWNILSGARRSTTDQGQQDVDSDEDRHRSLRHATTQHNEMQLLLKRSSPPTRDALITLSKHLSMSLSEIDTRSARAAPLGRRREHEHTERNTELPWRDPMSLSLPLAFNQQNLGSRLPAAVQTHARVPSGAAAGQENAPRKKPLPGGNHATKQFINDTALRGSHLVRQTTTVSSTVASDGAVQERDGISSLLSSPSSPVKPGQRRRGVFEEVFNILDHPIFNDNRANALLSLYQDKQMVAWQSSELHQRSGENVYDAVPSSSLSSSPPSSSSADSDLDRGMTRRDAESVSGDEEDHYHHFGDGGHSRQSSVTDSVSLESEELTLVLSESPDSGRASFDVSKFCSTAASVLAVERDELDFVVHIILESKQRLLLSESKLTKVLSTVVLPGDVRQGADVDSVDECLANMVALQRVYIEQQHHCVSLQRRHAMVRLRLAYSALRESVRHMSSSTRATDHGTSDLQDNARLLATCSGLLAGLVVFPCDELRYDLDALRVACARSAFSHSRRGKMLLQWWWARACRRIARVKHAIIARCARQRTVATHFAAWRVPFLVRHTARMRISLMQRAHSMRKLAHIFFFWRRHVSKVSFLRHHVDNCQGRAGDRIPTIVRFFDEGLVRNYSNGSHSNGKSDVSDRGLISFRQSVSVQFREAFAPEIVAIARMSGDILRLQRMVAGYSFRKRVLDHGDGADNGKHRASVSASAKLAIGDLQDSTDDDLDADSDRGSSSGDSFMSTSSDSGDSNVPSSGKDRIRDAGHLDDSPQLLELFSPQRVQPPTIPPSPSTFARPRALADSAGRVGSALGVVPLHRSPITPKVKFKHIKAPARSYRKKKKKKSKKGTDMGPSLQSAAPLIYGRETSAIVHPTKTSNAKLMELGSWESFGVSPEMQSTFAGEPILEQISRPARFAASLRNLRLR